MSTRACYIFKDGDQEIAVYKHSDGYPEGAKGALAKALDFAWPLPRYEADDFAAAFVAANKMADCLAEAQSRGDHSYDCIQGGGVRLLPHNLQDVWDGFPGDLEYVYLVEQEGRQLKVKAWSVRFDSDAKPVARWFKKPIKGWTIKPLENQRHWVQIPKAAVKVNLPTSIQVDDYHEFAGIGDNLEQIIPGVKVKEVGFVDGQYVGVVYKGKLTDPDVAKLVKQIKADTKAEEG